MDERNTFCIMFFRIITRHFDDNRIEIENRRKECKLHNQGALRNTASESVRAAGVSLSRSLLLNCKLQS